MLFISSAYAQTSSAAASGGVSVFEGLAPIIVVFVIMYLLFIRPQQKKMKEHKQLLSALKKNDYIVTSSGLYGTIVNIDQEEATLDINISKDVAIKIDITAVASVVAKNKKDQKIANDAKIQPANKTDKKENTKNKSKKSKKEQK